jgi:hypothetical protein
MVSAEEIRAMRDRSVVTLETIERILLSIQKSTGYAYSKDFHVEHSAAVSQIARLLTECREKINALRSGQPETPPETNEVLAMVHGFIANVNHFRDELTAIQQDMDNKTRRPNSTLTDYLAITMTPEDQTREHSEILHKIGRIRQLSVELGNMAIRLIPLQEIRSLPEREQHGFNDAVKHMIQEIGRLARMVS